MKPLRMKLQEACRAKKASQPVIEKDYALSYVLAGIATQADLAHSLVFKGGTALKKIFFGDYRFSEDLDFSTLNAPQSQALENALKDAIHLTKTLLTQYGPFEIELKRYPERAPHPTGQEAFNILVKFPWHPAPICRIKLEITHDEPVLLKPEYKPILHGYEEQIDCKVACYSIEEVIAEKMRALLQTHQKLIIRGWNRPRARDYYDLWYILKHYNSTINMATILDTLNKKCKHRNVSFDGTDDFFTPELLKEAHQHWKSTLGMLIQDLPECGQVIEQTRFLIVKLLGDD